MHISKTDFEFISPFEIVNITDENWYEIKKKRSVLIIEAVAYWLYSFSYMSDLLEMHESEENDEGKN